MSNIQVITKQRHSDKMWQPSPDYNFASKDVACTLVVQELTEIIMSLPTGFSKTNDGYVPICLLGLTENRNLVVNPSGSWRSSYVPDVYKCYPFSLVEFEGELVLCIDEDAANLTTDSGKPFFDTNGEVDETVAKILEFYLQNLEYKNQTAAICKLLDSYRLIEPWPIEIELNGEPHNVEGVYRISEAQLNVLSSDSLTEVRDSGGLLVAYSQLLSMGHLNKLIQLAQHETPVETKELDLDNIVDTGTLDFSNL